MPIFKTSHGSLDVTNWSYQLQGLNGAALNPVELASLGAGLLVTDYSRDGSGPNRFTPAEVDTFKANAVAVSYISIGEASDFQAYWHANWTSTGHATGALTSAAPGWLGPIDEAFPESRKVRYWDPDWQKLIFNDAHTGYLDQIVAQGFDGAYLDIVDAYYFWAAEATPAQRHAGDPRTEHDAAARMIDFIVAMTAHARQTNPDFAIIPQNGELIIDALAGTDPARKAAFLGSINAIAVEDVYLRNGTAAENNGFLPDKVVIAALKHDFLANGKAVFAVDYVNELDGMGRFIQAALADGFIPTVALKRGLDRTLAPLHSKDATGEGADLVAGTAASDQILGHGGNDTLFGFKGNDLLFGGGGDDQISGGLGRDKIDGGAGRDLLDGGLARDVLTGGAGRDTFDFNAPGDSSAGGARRDTITDFRHGQDRIDLSTMDANLTTAANDKFVWVGTTPLSGPNGAGQAGQLHAVIVNNPGRAHDLTIVEGDTNGDGAADIQIVLTGLIHLTARDFIL